MTTDERSWWHSYVYAWRRQFLNNHDRVSPPDPQGVWFMPRLVADAHRALYGYRKHRPEITPAMKAYNRGDYEAADRFDDQDRERRNFTGSDQEFAALCLRQVRGNLDRFGARTK